MTAMFDLPEAWADWLSGPGVPPLVRLLKIAFLVLALLWAARAWWVASRNGRPAGSAGLLSLGLALLFGAVLVHQASWQIAGFARPKFMDFVRRYDRRPVTGAEQVQRGRILACDGTVLAESDPDVPGLRRYPGAESCSHLLGYFDVRFGAAGIEAADDDYLSGRTLGSAEELRQFRRNLLRQDGIRGNDLALTVDPVLQRRATELLQGRRGAVVMLRPADGAVLALVSAPGYDPAHPETALADPTGESGLLNRAVNGLYPPGSSFKIVVAGLALDRKREPIYDCPGEGYTPVRGVRPIRDHEAYQAEEEGYTWYGHGRLSLTRAFELSSNVYFAHLAADLGAPALFSAAHQAGIGRPVVFFEGSSGRLASNPSRIPNLTAADRLEATQCAIGQGKLVVTPLHMALIASAVAADGMAWTPRIAERTPPKPFGRYFRAATAARLRKLMRGVVVHGTGHPADVAGLEIAGKTGTAEAPGGEPHGWFVGFAPASKPAVAFAVLVENAGYGSQTAAPIAADLVGLAKRRGWFKDGPPPVEPPSVKAPATASGKGGPS